MKSWEEKRRERKEAKQKRSEGNMTKREVFFSAIGDVLWVSIDAIVCAISFVVRIAVKVFD